MISRRLLLGGTLALATGLAGCRLGGDDDPPTPEFGAFTVSESGGVDGRFNRVEVETDGRTLVTGRTVAAGMLAADRLAEARRLLGSVDFAREAVESARRNPEPVRCSDQIAWSVTMGELTATLPDACGSGRSARRPTTRAIIGLVDEAWQGRFAAPLPASAPSLIDCRLSGTIDDRPYQITLARTGVVALDRDGRTTRVALTEPGRDALRLLLPRLLDRPGSCGTDDAARLDVAGTPVCLSGDRIAYAAVLRLLRETAGL